jgi:hypothetical protein
MNINASAAANIAGTSRAASRGGESDKQAAEATRQQSTAETPAGKAADSSAVDAGDQTDDRHGNGRQVLDVFERSDEDQPSDPESTEARVLGVQDGSGAHLDLEG